MESTICQQVNPGEDDLIHRAKSARETASQSFKNKFVNKVWYVLDAFMSYLLHHLLPLHDVGFVESFT